MNITMAILNSAIMEGINRSAPAMLTTSQGADDHQVRMSDMGSIAQNLHFHTPTVESVEDVEALSKGVFDK